MGISVLEPTGGALRDPRKFFLTNNLRFVKKVLSSSKLSANMKKRGNSKIIHLTHISHILIRLYDVLDDLSFCRHHHTDSVLIPAEGALRDPRKFFLTNNLRFVKNVEIRKIIHLTRPQYLAFCRHHHTDSVLIPAEGALRDPRKFFLTNNLRLGAYLLIQNGKPE